jgi:hypothetical protein
MVMPLWASWSVLPYLEITTFNSSGVTYKRTASETGRERHECHLPYLEVRGGGPDVPVVAADNCMLDQLCGEKLIVHITLPAHDRLALFNSRKKTNE